MVKSEKEMQREKLAEDIKTYLAKGGVVKTYSFGESVVDPLTEGWGRNVSALHERRPRATRPVSQ
jgi:hypothetical protein